MTVPAELCQPFLAIVLSSSFPSTHHREYVCWKRDQDSNGFWGLGTQFSLDSTLASITVLKTISPPGPGDS